MFQAEQTVLKCRGRAFTRFQRQSFPKQEINEKIRFYKNAVCGQFFKGGMMWSTLGLMVCSFWEVVLGKHQHVNIGFPR